MKKLLTVTGFTAMLTLLRMAAGFLVAKVVAVYAGPTGLALLGQLQNLVSVLNGIVTAPAGNAVVRFTAQNHQQGFEACAPWWRASLKWVGLLLLIVMPITMAMSEWLSLKLFDSDTYYWLIIIISSTLPFTVLGSLVNSVINGQQLYKRYVYLGMFSVVASSSIMVVLIVKFGIIGGLVSASIQNGLIGVILIVSSVWQPWFKIRYWIGAVEPKRMKGISSYMVMALCSSLCMPITLVLIRNVLVSSVGWEQAGHWQAVWKISEVYLSVITISLGAYYLPRLSSMSCIKDVRNEVLSTLKVVMPIVVVLAASVFFMRDVLIDILFTDEFRQSRELFLVQLLGDVVKIASWIYSYPILSRGMVREFVLSEMFFAFSFFFLSVAFVGNIGISGVTVSYLLSCCFYFLLVFYLSPISKA